MHHEVGTEVERSLQIRRRERAIDQQRQPCLVGDLRHRRDIEHIEARVTERLGEQQPGRRPDTGAPGVEIAWIDEARVEAEAAQRVVQEVVRPTVERSARENMGSSTG